MPGPKLVKLPSFYQKALNHLFAQAQVNNRNGAPVTVNLSGLNLTDEQKIAYLVAKGVDVSASIQHYATQQGYYQSHLLDQAAYLNTVVPRIAVPANVDPEFQRVYQDAFLKVQAAQQAVGQPNAAQLMGVAHLANKALAEKIIAASIDSLKTTVPQVQRIAAATFPLVATVQAALGDANLDSSTQPAPAGRAAALAALKTAYQQAGLQFDEEGFNKLYADNKQRAIQVAAVEAHLKACRQATLDQLDKTKLAVLADEAFMQYVVENNAGLKQFFQGRNAQPTPQDVQAVCQNMFVLYAGTQHGKANDLQIHTRDTFKRDFRNANEIFDSNNAQRRAQAEFAASQRDASGKLYIGPSSSSNQSLVPMPDSFNAAQVFTVPGSHPQLKAMYKNGVWEVLNSDIEPHTGALGLIKKGGMKIADGFNGLFDPDSQKQPAIAKEFEGLSRAQIIGMYIMIWQRDVIDKGAPQEEMMVSGSTKHRDAVLQGVVATGAKVAAPLQQHVDSPAITSEALQKVQTAFNSMDKFHKREAIAEVDTARGEPARAAQAEQEATDKAAIADMRQKAADLRRKMVEFERKINVLERKYETLRGARAQEHPVPAAAAVAPPPPPAGGLAARAAATVAAAATAAAAAARNATAGILTPHHQRFTRGAGRGNVPAAEQEADFAQRMVADHTAMMDPNTGDIAVCTQLRAELVNMRTNLRAGALTIEETNSLNSFITKVDEYLNKVQAAPGPNVEQGILHKINAELGPIQFGQVNGQTQQQGGTPGWW